LGYNDGGFQGAEKRVADILAERSESVFIAPFLIATHYLFAGDKKNAILWLEKAYREHGPNLPYLLSPIWDTLRDNPEFQEIVRRMNLPVI